MKNLLEKSSECARMYAGNKKGEWIFPQGGRIRPFFVQKERFGDEKRREERK